MINFDPPEEKKQVHAIKIQLLSGLINTPSGMVQDVLYENKFLSVEELKRFIDKYLTDTEIPF